MRKQIYRNGTTLAVIALTLAIGCTKQPTASDTSSDAKNLPEAKAFDGEVYRTRERRETITIVSKDELEIKTGDMNLICKYTRQNNQFRVVANVAGTSQALYYRIIEDGLEDEKGRIFYKASRLPNASEPAPSSAALDQAWAQACSLYQRRADLIPNVLNTVGNSPTISSSLLDAVREARRAVGTAALNSDRAPIDRVQMEGFELAQQQLGRALSQLLLAASRSPDLKNHENFSALQAQLEGTENRISGARVNFNQTVQSYNATLPPGAERRPFFSHPTY